MNGNDDAVRRQYAYERRHPGTVFNPGCEHDPRWRARLDDGVDVWAPGLRQLLNHLDMTDPVHLLLPWRADGPVVYAVAGDEPGDGDTLIGVMDTAELAAAACAVQNGRLAARGGLAVPVRPGPAASQAGI